MKKWLVLWGLVGAFLLGGAQDVSARKYKELGLTGKVKSVRTIYGFGTSHELIYEYLFSEDGLLFEERQYNSTMLICLIRYDHKERQKEEMAGDILKLSYVYDEANQKYEVKDEKDKVVYFGELDDQMRISSRKNISTYFPQSKYYTYGPNGKLTQTRTVSSTKVRESVDHTLYYPTGYPKESRWRSSYLSVGKDGKSGLEYQVVFSSYSEKGWPLSGGHYWENDQGEITRWSLKSSFSYEEIDSHGNWMTQIKKDELTGKKYLRNVIRQIIYYEE